MNRPLPLVPRFVVRRACDIPAGEPLDLAAVPDDIRRLSRAFPAAAIKCRNERGWCILQGTGRGVASLLELNARAKAMTAWVDTGGPRPRTGGGADAAARDILKRGAAKRRKKHGALVLKPLSSTTSFKPRLSRRDPFHQKPATRSRVLWEWQRPIGLKLAAAGVCTHCIRATLDISIGGMYMAKHEGATALDHWGLRQHSTPINGTRQQRKLMPLNEISKHECCRHKCCSILPQATLEYYWDQFAAADSRNGQDAVLATLLFDPRGGHDGFCDKLGELWFGLEPGRRSLVRKALLKSGSHVIDHRLHRGAGHVAWNRTPADILSTFRVLFFTRVKESPEEGNVLLCVRHANGPRAIIDQFFLEIPGTTVAYATLIREIVLILEEGGYDGLAKFIKDHNVCPKCEATLVGIDNAEARRVAAVAANNPELTRHWELKKRAR